MESSSFGNQEPADLQAKFDRRIAKFAKRNESKVVEEPWGASLRIRDHGCGPPF